MAFFGVACLAAFADAEATKKASGEDAKKPVARVAAVASMKSDELSGYEIYPKQVRSLIESSLALTHLDLTYKFGGSNPNEGGMDCSGTIYHVLRFQGLKDVPRQSDEMCEWVRDHSTLHLTPTAKSLDDAEFASLRPGDLIFWTGTYKTERKLPITHVMLYVGKEKKTGRPVVFGSSDGRYYAGERRCGVSVFDFTLPRADSEALVYGFGTPPGLVAAAITEEVRKPQVVEAAPLETKEIDKPVIPTQKTTVATKAKVEEQPPEVTTIKKPSPVKKAPAKSAKASEAKAKSSPAKKQSVTPKQTHSAPKEPEPSPARKALDQTGAAINRVADSIRGAFR